MIGVNVIGEGTGRSSPEMGKELVFSVEGDDREGEFLKDRSGWGGQGDDSNGGFDHRRREVLNGNLCEWDAVDDFFELKVDVGVLSFVGGRVLELRALNISLLHSDIGENMEEIGWGVDAIDSDDGGDRGNTVTFTSGAGAIEGTGVVPSVVRTVEEVLDNLVGGSDVQLIDIVNLGPRDGGEGGGGDGSGGEGRRRHWVQLASLKRLF